MSLLHYFSTVSADKKLLDSQGAFARDMLSSVISAANMEVKHTQNEQQPTLKSKWESYAKFTGGQKAEIGQRAAEHKIASAICHFAKKYCLPFPHVPSMMPPSKPLGLEDTSSSHLTVTYLCLLLLST